MLQQVSDKRPAFDQPLFNLGQLAMTPGVEAVAERGEFNPIQYLARHQSGDWGELPPSDWNLNNRSVSRNPKERGRLFSAYVLPCGTKIWVITEWDRSVTTILLPDEY
ncbi:MAG: hypothetical protein FWD67_12500 [Betaproteobacteria bacterium]|nr:hypothetical protein [Betaproteobacteria bacterium]